MKKQSPILQKASEYVFAIMRDKIPGTHLYHNYDHTVAVVEAVDEIAEGADLSKEETEMVLLAGWFHDTGFTEKYYGHEDVSKEIAERFLRENLYPEEKIQKIIACIEATRYPQHPTNILEGVLCDADLSGIAGKKYMEKANFLRREREMVQEKVVSDQEWYQSEIEFLSAHKYYTPYAHLKFDHRKAMHVLELKDLLKETQEDSQKDLKKKMDKTSQKMEKEKKPERGIETMFRVAMSNHMNLSKMADDKANFLLSINGIILSFAIANLLSKFDTTNNAFLILPTGVLMIVCLLSLIFAILSTRPKVAEGKSSRADIEGKKANLLFFGNFHSMSFEDFKWGFNEMMADKEYLYGSLIKDLYFLGKVLGVKYKLIRTAYTIFMWGIILTVFSYAASYYYYFHVLGQAPTPPIIIPSY